MASEVDICNLALGHLGDNATVASLDPPEGSAQAEHCARFYPIARDGLLELHDWNFATKRVQPAQVAFGFNQWKYAYELPSDCLNVISVLDPDAPDDYAGVLPMAATQFGTVNAGQGIYQPQPFACETDDQDRQVVLTNQENAIVRYVAFVTDTTRFSPLYVTALSWKLAAMLAGPVIKGEEGRAEAKRCEAMAAMYLGRAAESDAAQRRITPRQSVNWMVNR